MKRRLLLILSLFFLIPALADAGSRDQLSVSGMVFDNDGNPLSGSLSVTFRIYDASEGGSSLWEETRSIDFEGGVYQVALGAATPLPNDLFDHEELFLAVQIEGDSEMTPRLTLYSVPWAKQAEFAVTAQSLLDNVVTTQTIAPGAITSAKIAAGAVGSAELASSGVTPGSYTLSNITVDADGRITAASNGAAGGSGTVASVGSGAGLTGGPITTSGTLSVNFGGSGAATTVSRSDHTHAAADIASGQLTDAQVSDALTIAGGTLENTPIGGTTASTGKFTTLETTSQAGQTFDPFGVAAGNTGEERFLELAANGSNYVGFKAPNAIAANQVWVLPAADGTVGQILSTDGSGALSWATVAGTGTVTSVGSGTGLLGGPITTSGTLSVDVGTTASKIVQLNGSAQLPAISGVNLTSLNAGNISSGTVGVVRGGTGADLSATGGANQFVKQTSGGGAFSVATISDADVPNSITIDSATQATSLAANGSNCSSGNYSLGVDASGNAEGCTAAATGTVTSVGSGTGLTGGAITTSGTLSLNYSATLAGNPALTAGQAAFDSGDNSSNGGVLFEGAAADAFEGVLTVTDPTADRTWTLPDVTGTIALTSSDITGNAATATALVANGTNCAGGEYAAGVDASGNAEGCTVASGSGTVTSVGSGSGLTGGPITAAGTLDIGAGKGIAVNTDDIQLKYSDTLSSNSMGGGEAVFDAGDSQGGVLFEGSTMNAFEGMLTVTDPTADRTWTLPDVTGTIALTSSNISGNASTATALATNGSNCSAGNYSLGVDASGNAEGCTAAGTGTVTSVSTSIGLTGGPVTTSGTLSFDYSATLAGNPALTSGQAVFDSADNGILFEGATADTNEGVLQATTLTADRTWTLPDTTGTLVTTGDSQTVTSTMIADATITNADISGTAGITDAQVNDNLTVSGGTINNTPVGATTRSTGAFSTVGVGTSSPAATAALEISSTSLGFLPPRMTTAQRDAISSPATGLVAYVTDKTTGYYQYNGTSWVTLFSPSTIPIKRTTADRCIGVQTGPVTCPFSGATATLQNDTDMVFAAQASEVWQIEGTLHTTNANATPDIKVGFRVPAGATIEVSVRGVNGATLSASGIITASGGSLAVPITAAGDVAVFYEGIVVMGGTAGNIQFQWAQNTSDATAGRQTIVKANSYIKGTLVQ